MAYCIDCEQGKLAERNPKSKQSVFCTSVKPVQKQTVLHYQPNKSRLFWKVVVATPNLVAQARGKSFRLEVLVGVSN